ncbi:DsbA family protein [Pseudomonas sp. CBSPBW29]|uniref:DsbA family protein n=1 Tax=Pseudomonas TaxID=286 RepID=UPI0021ACB31B|nr:MULTISPECIES: DsbA family protein [unclassified Pseudomonas]WEL40352.1 DsbA family protein [Pseudomonas sp. CBSPBW29]WEL70600.1 DsbA family protein [Pseudomonas sp. CBSPCGW29]WEL77520.1 DsbA family protein [Pseudomonas sp. CBSPAW29]WEL83852.1 DsbA family protein [Pseudomonas sp. CBSPCAW29]WEL86698.1 DsbA family protein [Pseudomonas sp. CBSPCBW29]
MSAATLHYIYDPLCGWCYGAEPLLHAAHSVLPIQLHGGGMMTGANRQSVSPQLRDYVMPHDRRIAEYTGQPFGEAYFEGLLRDHDAVFDSAPPITAVLAAEKIAGRGLELLARLQTAHYVEGRRIADRDVLRDLAESIGLDPQVFNAAFSEFLGADTQAHIKNSRQWLAKIGGQGFPTLALEQDEQLHLIDISPWLGKPEAFAEWLRQRVAISIQSTQSSAPMCGLQGCEDPRSA